ncbi:hypothetical protein SDC9_143210 [bioreactor metagenome]|uniref:Uncharacterized protein n=1 Tax=bioreactor metagenome TaxID=1076179 RepID=A0A645E2N3_9ZZZZ
MPNETRLGGLVVIGGDVQQGISSRILCMAGKIGGGGGVVAAGARHHLCPVVDIFDAELHRRDVLADA